MDTGPAAELRVRLKEVELERDLYRESARSREGEIQCIRAAYYEVLGRAEKSEKERAICREFAKGGPSISGGNISMPRCRAVPEIAHCQNCSRLEVERQGCSRPSRSHSPAISFNCP
jgi:hypothetical protein